METATLPGETPHGPAAAGRAGRDPAAEAAALDAALIRLHRRGEPAALSALHERAAALLAGDAGARRFHLTQAWVHALEAGERGAVERLAAALAAAGGLDRF